MRNLLIVYRCRSGVTDTLTTTDHACANCIYILHLQEQLLCHLNNTLPDITLCVSIKCYRKRCTWMYRKKEESKRGKKGGKQCQVIVNGLCSPLLNGWGIQDKCHIPVHGFMFTRACIIEQAVLQWKHVMYMYVIKDHFRSDRDTIQVACWKQPM